MFKSSKEYFEEINNKNRSDVRDDYFTFNEYERSFYFRLIGHLDYYVDSNHIDFIDEELYMMEMAYKKIKQIEGFLPIDKNNLALQDMDDKLFLKYWISNLKKPSAKKRKVSEARSSIGKMILFLNLKKINQFDKDEILTQLKEQNKPVLDTNLTQKHDAIFCNNGFLLFDHILNEYVKTKRGRLSDIHFFYWSMFEDKFIHQRPERFKEWFLKNHEEDLGKIKTYNEVENPDRQKHYSNALDWFKLQNL
jgi:hypothetical protein